MPNDDDAFGLIIGKPRNGWMRFDFTSGERQLSIDASYTPHDSFAELIDAAGFVKSGILGRRIVTFNEEPSQLELVVDVGAGAFAFGITRYRDHRRSVSGHSEQILSGACAVATFVRVIGAAARDVVAGEDGAFVAAWGHPFPRAALDKLDA
jgi:hypothetical protein